MPVADPAPTRSTRLRRVLLGLLVLALYGAVVEAVLGWGSLARSLVAAGIWPVLLALSGLLASYALRARRIQKAEPRIPDGGLPDVVRVFALYNVSNWLLPARLGEASLPLLLQRRYGTPLGRGAGVLLWLRVLDLHVIAVLGGLVLLLQPGPWRLLGALGLVGGLLLPWLATHFVSRLARRWPKAQALAEVMPRQLAAAAGDFGLAWAAWTVKLGTLGAALSLLSGLAYAAGILGALGGDVSGVLPLHAPLGAGSYEAGVLLGLAPWHPELKTALAAAVQLHALMLASALALGLLALPTLGRRASLTD